MRTDIFGLTPRQHDMFGAPQGVFDTPMTVDEIRAELQRTLDLLRSSDSIPWPTRQEIMIRNMFPEICSKLPASEATELVDAFNTEIRRLHREAA